MVYPCLIYVMLKIVVMNGDDEFIEVQGTAEGATFSRPDLDVLLNLAQKGISELLVFQQKFLH